ncbi:MAG: DUF1080 domain-containing protein [Phycisphaerae bacterium]|jgi:hypothetical protein
MTAYRLAVTLALLALGCCCTPAQTTQPAEGTWTPLLHGDTLDGWTQRGGGATYRVDDGEIIGQTVPNTPNTFLCTDQLYGDFILELEFKVDPRLNSGVQIRSNSVPGYRHGVVHGYQVEIDPSDRAWSAGIYDESRRGWLCDLEKNEAARQAFRQNEWNALRIVARGPRMQTWLNGVPAADLTDDLTRTGFIALQVHGTTSTEPLEVRWRKLRIQDLGIPDRTPPAGAIVLLDAGGDLSAWQHPDRPGQTIGWKFHDGALEIEPGTGSIITRRPFGDCRLHVEFCTDDNGQTGQANGNSGVYLQSRYEVQVLNSAGQEPALDNCGAIYGVKAPDMNMALPAGQWQTYDITFRAPRCQPNGEKRSPARLTVYQNGTRIHDNVEIPQNTGTGQPEAPGDAPLLLQDHGNRIRYRNIWIAPLPAAAEDQ